MKIKSLTLSFAVIISFVFFAANSANSQENIEVKVEKAVMSKGMQPGYVVKIPMAVLKDVQNSWIKKLQENIKIKVVTTKDEQVLSNAVLSEITLDTISVYSLFIEKEDGVVMNVFVEIDGVFFSPSEDKTQLSAEKTDSSIKNYIRNFAVAQYRLAAEKSLDAETENLEDLQKELENLGKDNENMKKEISSLENEIEKTEREISSLDKEIELKDNESLGHKASMALLATEEEKKAAEEKDKTLEKEKSKLEKERTGLKNDISDMKSDIEKNNKDIADNEKAQEEVQEQIAAQEAIVAKSQELLNGIK